MIKATVIGGSAEESALFSEGAFFIGDPKDAREKISFFPLPGIGLKPEHIKVSFVNGKLVVQNLANDPFVTLDGLPFYKKETSTGAILRIRERDLRLEIMDEASDLAIKPLAKPVRELPVRELPVRELPVRELPVRELSEQPEPIEEMPAPTPIRLLPKEDSESYKDEERDEAEEAKNWTAHLNVSPFRHVRLYSLFLMFFFLVLSVVGVESYLRAGEKSDEDEAKAAESLADIAMALTYAQVYHFAPEKHNWSDPTFIQNNLLATLPTGSSSGLKLNSQGEFADSSYFLRVYTSNDLSRFLIIAHPNPTLLQWLIPKSALVVDSNSMEIRRIHNVKAMNRLLATLNTLDGINLSQISDLIKNEEVIQLSHLAKMVKKPEFQPPRVLAFLRPGAENLIYNAPRYHPFGDALLKKASHFASVTISSHELSMLQAELEILKKFPNLVLYTTKSIEEGKSAVNALKKIGPHERYILASIKHDSRGRFLSSKVVMDHEEKPKTQFKKQAPYIAKVAVFEVPNPTSSEEIAFQMEEKPDPLVTRLKEISELWSQNRELHKKSAYAATDKYLAAPNKKRLFKALRKTRLKLKEEDVKTKEALYELTLNPDLEKERFQEILENVGLKGLWNAS